MVETLLHVSDSLAAADGRSGDGGVDLGGLANVVRQATARDVDAVVHTGNLFRRPDPRPDAVEAVRAELAELGDAGIPCFVVAGDRESRGDDDAIARLRDGGAVRELSEAPTTIGEVALFGVDHVDSGTALLDRLRALEPADDFSYNVVCVNQRIWPPLPESDAHASAFDLVEATDVYVDEVLAGGHESPRVWESDDFDYRVTYSGSTRPEAGDAGEAAVGTLVRAGTDEHGHERIPLTGERSHGRTSPADERDHEGIPPADPGVTDELEQLREALDFRPADLEDVDAETLADLYGLAARAKRVFEDRRSELRDELLERVDGDRRIQGEYASVDRTTQRRRTVKPEPEVLDAVRRAGIDREAVLTPDASALRDLADEGEIDETAVFDVERRPYVRVGDTTL